MGAARTVDFVAVGRQGYKGLVDAAAKRHGLVEVTVVQAHIRQGRQTDQRRWNSAHHLGAREIYIY
jgi:hypothetical protein